MKQISFFKFTKVMALTLVMALGFAACNDDDDNGTDPVIVEDGIYVKGPQAALTDFDFKGMMRAAKNEVTQEARGGFYELFITLKAGSEGFSIVKVAGTQKISYGPAAGFETTLAADKWENDEPAVDIQRGPVAANSAVFTVPEDGLYHVVFDTVLMKAAIIPVEHWAVIGAATPGGWSTETPLDASAFNANTMSFEGITIKLGKGEFKFRYSNGWKVGLDTTLDVGSGKKGVKINTNFGKAIDDLEAGGNNIVNNTIGFFTINMTWTLADGYAATLTKTGDVESIDYTSYEMGIIGNAYFKPATTDTAGWDVPWGLSAPVVDAVNKVYTWTYTGIELFAGKEFKFRQGDDWSGKSIGFGDVVWAGAAAAKFENNGGNIKVLEAGTYTIELKIEALSETYTVTATKTSK